MRKPAIWLCILTSAAALTLAGCCCDDSPAAHAQEASSYYPPGTAPTPGKVPPWNPPPSKASTPGSWPGPLGCRVSSRAPAVIGQTFF